MIPANRNRWIRSSVGRATMPTAAATPMQTASVTLGSCTTRCVSVSFLLIFYFPLQMVPVYLLLSTVLGARAPPAPAAPPPFRFSTASMGSYMVLQQQPAIVRDIHYSIHYVLGCLQVAGCARRAMPTHFLRLLPISYPSPSPEGCCIRGSRTRHCCQGHRLEHHHR